MPRRSAFIAIAALGGVARAAAPLAAAGARSPRAPGGLAQAASVGWFEDGSALDASGALGSTNHALQRMNELLRRQLNEVDGFEPIGSFDTGSPTGMPTPVPTPAPTGGNRTVCPEGTFFYELALFAYEGDGWTGDEEANLFQYLGNPALDVKEKINDEPLQFPSGSESVEDFCLENGNYVTVFGPSDTQGIQWLPDDTQYITECRGPCEDQVTMIDGLVIALASQAPTVTPAPTGEGARRDTEHTFSYVVNGIPDGTFQADTTKLILQNAMNDVIPIVESPDQVVRAELLPVDARRRLQADPTSHRVLSTILMGDPYKTCGEVGFTSAQACLDGIGHVPPSLVESMDEAIADGSFKERLLYWANFYNAAWPDDITIDGVECTPDDEQTECPNEEVQPNPPFWEFAGPRPTVSPAPTMTIAPSATPTVTPAPTSTMSPTATRSPTVTPKPSTEPAPTVSSIPTASPAPSSSPAPTVTPAPSTEVRPRKSKKKKSQKLSTGEIVAIVVCCILAFLICLLCCLYYKQRERKNTERKDSWDISTMFSGEEHLPDDANTAAPGAPATDEATELSGSQQAASADPASEPQELQKITQARLGVEIEL